MIRTGELASGLELSELESRVAQLLFGSKQMPRELLLASRISFRPSPTGPYMLMWSLPPVGMAGSVQVTNDVDWYTVCYDRSFLKRLLALLKYLPEAEASRIRSWIYDEGGLRLLKWCSLWHELADYLERIRGLEVSVRYFVNEMRRMIDDDGYCVQEQRLVRISG